MSQLTEYTAHHPWLVAYAAAAAVAVFVYESLLRARSTGAVSPQGAIQLMNQGAAVLDLRPAEAFAQGHIAGAKSFDRGQIDAAEKTLKRYRERAVIVYCESGVTAGQAARSLLRQGFTRVVNLRGGIAAWRAENLPLAKD